MSDGNRDMRASRATSKETIDKLIQTDLFRKHIENDLRNGDVFLAMRGNSISFYYKGGLLFSYQENRGVHKYVTNRKYIPFIDKGTYVGESDIFVDKVSFSFSDPKVYSEIKEAVENYGGPERIGVSCLVKEASPFFQSNDKRVICLDTEIYIGGNSNEDRIDLLLLDLESGNLRFVEAKHFGNPEIWSHEHTRPAVVGQIARYNETIGRDREDLLGRYVEYAKSLKHFGLELKRYPTSLDEQCQLYIFGFDGDQRDGRLKKLLVDDGSLKGINYYLKGNESGIVPENLWKKTGKGT